MNYTLPLFNIFYNEIQRRVREELEIELGHMNSRPNDKDIKEATIEKAQEIIKRVIAENWE